MSNLVFPFPQKDSRLFWVCAKSKIPIGQAISGQFGINATIPFRNWEMEIGLYRIVKFRYSGNWTTTDYQRAIADQTLETPTSSLGNVVDSYKNQILDSNVDLSEYFELDWSKTWYNNLQGNTLAFRLNLNLTSDVDILQEYGNVFEARCFLQVQTTNDDKYCEAFNLGKI